MIIDGAPVAKGRPRFTRSKIAFTPAKTRAYESRGRSAALEAMGKLDPLTGPLTATIVAYMPIPKSRPKRWQAEAKAGDILPTSKPDADNLAKSILDSMAGVVFTDDAQIVDLNVSKRYSMAPHALVIVTKYKGVKEDER